MGAVSSRRVMACPEPYPALRLEGKVAEHRRTPVTPLLHLAAYQGDRSAVLHLILLEEDWAQIINRKDQNEWTPLHYAAEQGHVAILRLLLERGAEIDAKNQDEWTPLHLAANRGHLKAVHLLLDKGAKINMRTQLLGATPLHLAADMGHVDVVEWLLERGSELEAITKDEWTPLHFAADRGHKEAMLLLLDKGAEIDRKTQAGETSLHLAAFKGHEDVVVSLMEHGANKLVEVSAKVCCPWRHLCVPFGTMYANCRCDICKAEYEISKDALSCGLCSWDMCPACVKKVEGTLHQGATALHLAALQGHKYVVELMLREGVDVACYDKYKRTPLHYAAKQGRMAVILLLLENGAQIGSPDLDQWTPLHFAAEQGRQEVVLLLLECGAQIDAKNLNGDTPLHVARGAVVDLLHTRLMEASTRTTLYMERYRLPVDCQPLQSSSDSYVLLGRDLDNNPVAIKFFSDRAARDRSVAVMQQLGDTFACVLAGTLEEAVFADEKRFPQAPYALAMTGGGRTLADVMRAKEASAGMAANQLRWCFWCIAEAVHHMHSKDLVHHDLKPANCVQYFDGRFRLVDFDNSGRDSDENHDPVRSITPEVCPPNIARLLLALPAASDTASDTSSQPHGRVSKSTDMWSLGCLLYQMLEGRRLVDDLCKLGDDGDCCTVDLTPEATLAMLAGEGWQQDRTAADLKLQRMVDDMLRRIEDNRGSQAVAVQAVSALKRLLKVKPSARISVDNLMLHPFRQGDQSETYKRKGIERVEGRVEVLSKKVDAISGMVARIEELPVLLQQHLQLIMQQVTVVQKLVVNIHEIDCPRTFCIVPAVPVDLFSHRWDAKFPGNPSLSYLSSHLTRWLNAIEQLVSPTLSSMDSFVNLLAMERLVLYLVCDRCCKPCADGSSYTIDKPTEWTVKLLPAMKMALIGARLYNTAALVARCFMPAVPQIPQEIMDRATAIANRLCKASSVEDFACIQEAVDESDNLAPKKQAGAALRQLKAFLREQDRHCRWADLTRITNDDGDVLWVCPTCLNPGGVDAMRPKNVESVPSDIAEDPKSEAPLSDKPGEPPHSKPDEPPPSSQLPVTVSCWTCL